MSGAGQLVSVGGLSESGSSVKLESINALVSDDVVSCASSKVVRFLLVVVGGTLGDASKVS